MNFVYILTSYCTEYKINVCNNFELKFLRVIQWPSPEQHQRTAMDVQDICSLPGAVGFIGGLLYSNIQCITRREGLL